MRPTSLLWAVLGFILACGGGAEPGPAALAPAVEVGGMKVMALHRHEVMVNDHSFVVWEKSPKASHIKGVIVLVHGRTWSSLPDFDLQVPGEKLSLMDSLVAAGYSTFALDQRGYGETKRDQTGWLTPNKASADLSEVLRWVRARTNRVPALLGWSYGSMVSHLCVQRDASVVSALILYGYPRAIDSQYQAGPSAVVAPPRKVTTAEAAAEDFIAGEVVSPAMVKAFVKQALLSDPVRVDWRNKDQFSELNPRKLQVPTLPIHGALDPYAPRAAQQKIYDALPHSRKRWVVLEGGDHAAHLEATSSRFVHELVHFLQ
ncbi:MAG: alpha/beta fold hydrolase [Kofleriaceae bacterium]|nr:alpha/beta fold hydrolase [Kofleriaceae bacterium]